VSKSKSEKNQETLRKLNEAQEEMTAEQEAELVADYDAALEEWMSKDKPKQIKFRGKLFTVPQKEPFAHALFVSRHTKFVFDKKQNRKVPQLIIPDDKGEEYVRLILGNDFLREIEKSGADVNFVMQKIIPDIRKMWGSGQEKKEEQGDSKNK